MPGHSGNPKGRPPNASATSVLREHIDLDSLAKALKKLIDKGELSAITYAFDRFDGKPKQSTELTGENGGPVELKWHDNSSA